MLSWVRDNAANHSTNSRAYTVTPSAIHGECSTLCTSDGAPASSGSWPTPSLKHTCPVTSQATEPSSNSKVARVAVMNQGVFARQAMRAGLQHCRRFAGRLAGSRAGPGRQHPPAAFQRGFVASESLAAVGGEQGRKDRIRIEVAREQHRLEAFAHLARQGQALDLLCQRVARGFVRSAVVGGGERGIESRRDQELGLKV